MNLRLGHSRCNCYCQQYCSCASGTRRRQHGCITITLGIIASQLNINAPVSTLPSLTSVALKNVKDPNSKALIRQVGAESIVLLKNTNDALPLKHAEYIALFGKDSANLDYGASRPEDVSNFLGDTYDSHLASGGGSSLSQTPYIISPLDAFNTLAQNNVVTQLHYILSDNFTLNSPIGVFGSSGASFNSYAGSADTCLVFLNAYANGGADRQSLADPVGDLLVNNVANKCNNTIVIINGAGARLVDGFVAHPNVTVR
jgi:beta-glucosidase